MTTDTRTVRPRRVVTGHDAEGGGRVLRDEAVAAVKFLGPGVASTLMWVTDRCPAPIPPGDVAEADRQVPGTPPPPHGTRFCVLELAPGTRSAMHRTETIDYIAMLSGRIEMEMDDGTVVLEPGDIMIQRGTTHAWVNRGEVPARFAVVLVDAEPLGIGRPLGRDETCG